MTRLWPQLNARLGVPLALLAFALIGHWTELTSPFTYGTELDHQIRYDYLLEEFSTQFKRGIWYPRWLYGLNGGYGYPTFLIYQPGLWFFSLPFTYLTDSPDLAVKLAKLGVTLLRMGAMYALGRLLGCDRRLLVALIGLFTVDISLAAMHVVQRCASTFALWGFVCFFWLKREVAQDKPVFWPVMGLAASAAATLYCHPFVFCMSSCILAALATGACLEYREWKARRILLLSCGAALALALVWAAPYWLSAATLIDRVDMARFNMAIFDAYNNVKRMTHNPWRTVKTLHGSCGNFMIVAVTGLFAASVIWALAYRRRAYIPLLLLYLFVVFMLTAYSGPIWRAVTPLRSLQFPERISDMIGAIRLILILAALGWVSQRYRQRLSKPSWQAGAMLAAAFILVLMGGMPGMFQPLTLSYCAGKTKYVPVEYRFYRQHLDKTRFLTFQGANELLPRNAWLSWNTNRYANGIPIVQLFGAQQSQAKLMMKAGEAYPWFPIAGRVDIPAGKTPRSALRINQLYFPGWKILVNGQELLPGELALSKAVALKLTPAGTMRLEFYKPGGYSFEAYYDGPPGWPWRNAAMLVLTVLLVAAWWRYSKRLSGAAPARHETF